MILPLAQIMQSQAANNKVFKNAAFLPSL